MIVGVSFIATPAKFLAPSISLQEALDVGRATFFVFEWVECALAVVLIFILFRLKQSQLTQAVCIFVLTVLGIQYFYLLPALDHRVELILQDQEIAKSSLHYFYVAAEALKVVTLIVLGFMIDRNQLLQHYKR